MPQVVSEGDSEWHQSATSAGCASTATKRLQDSFHLINDGNTVWSEGDVIVSTGAAFVNRGTLRLLESSSAASSNTGDIDNSARNFEPPRIRAPRKGDRVCTAFDESNWGVESAGGAGSDGGGAADWAWEEHSYDGHEI